jgi:hypothetical protein
MGRTPAENRDTHARSGWPKTKPIWYDLLEQIRVDTLGGKEFSYPLALYDGSH